VWRVESARTWCLDGITGVGGAATAKPNVGKTLNGWEKDKPELSLVAGRGEVTRCGGLWQPNAGASACP
jgi:hypothetical protein